MAHPLHLRVAALLGLVALTAACLGRNAADVAIGGEGGGDLPGVSGEPPPGPFVAAPGALRRLTAAEYAASIRALLGEGLNLPPLPADSAIAGFTSVGAAQTSISELGVEMYETAALSVAGQVFANASRRQALVGCDPSVDACVRGFIQTFGRRAFRRTLESAEVQRYAQLNASSRTQLADAWRALQFTTAALLQAPSFLYRAEQGVDDGTGARRYTGVELASRLSYLLTGGPPDLALLDAAEGGTLDTAEGLRAQAMRLLGKPSSPGALAHFFEELLVLEELHALLKEHPRMSPTLTQSMHQELRRVFKDHLETDAQLPELLTRPRTFVNAELAGLYGLPYSAPTSSMTVTGAGADIWGTADGLHYVRTSHNGDGELVVRVASFDAAHAWAKAGPMWRASLEAGALHASMIVTKANGVVLLSRSAAGGLTQDVVVPGVAAPVWLRLTRAGATFTGAYSTDGVTWTQVGAATVALPATALAGLAVTSHDVAARATAVLEQVRLSQGGAPRTVSWAGADVGAVGLSGRLELPDAFVEATFSPTGPRLGLLGMAGFLAVKSHPTRTSPTHRGIFIRQALLCQSMPPPPGDVDTTFQDADAPTARERLTQHRTDPVCASCHAMMDPIGLGLENFDQVGELRMTENNVTIDPSGQLDGQAFAGARDLAAAVGAHPRLGPCLVRNLYRHATAHVETGGEAIVLYELSTRFREGGQRLKALLLDLVSSDGFRFASDPT